MLFTLWKVRQGMAELKEVIKALREIAAELKKIRRLKEKELNVEESEA